MKQKLISGLLTLCILLCFIVALVASHQDIAKPDHRHELSEGIQNIVKRAYQMTDIQWTPQHDIIGWNGDVVYESGITYTGLPYGQAVNASYVPLDSDLDEFIEAVNDPYSKMYTDRSDYKHDAPYYSCDCSCFVSWAWGLDTNMSTKKIPTFTLMISDTSFEDLQVGDCLCRPAYHTVLITDIIYDKDDEICAIEVSESTTKISKNDCCIRTWYGADSDRSLGAFQQKYLDRDYVIYRFPGRDDVTYTHSCASPLPGDICEICGYGMGDTDE